MADCWAGKLDSSHGVGVIVRLDSYRESRNNTLVGSTTTGTETKMWHRGIKGE